VAVVPLDAPTDQPYKRVVVGVDGSKSSIGALVWAVRTASEDQVVEAVYTWTSISAAFPEAGILPAEQYEAAAEQRLATIMATARELLGTEDHEILPRIIEGDARFVLREESATADLLVLGARRHRGFAHAVLGSVTTGLVHQPLTTTVVVPSPR